MLMEVLEVLKKVLPLAVLTPHLFNFFAIFLYPYPLSYRVETIVSRYSWYGVYPLPSYVRLFDVISSENTRNGIVLFKSVGSWGPSGRYFSKHVLAILLNGNGMILNRVRIKWTSDIKKLPILFHFLILFCFFTKTFKK